MKRTGVIIVAGGSGQRMGAAVPKQFLPLCGVPVLAVTLRGILAALPESPIVVVLPDAEAERWKDICLTEGLEGTHDICVGGTSRFESVRNGLAALGDCDYVAVHDGVRPLASKDLIMRCINTAEKYGTAIPAVRPVDSFRSVDTEGNRIIDRDTLRAVQTPQVFRRDIITDAYQNEYALHFTDDASVVESVGIKVTLCDGERINIKITTPEDMAIAETLMKLSE